MVDVPVIVGSIGVGMLLIAFLLNLLNILSQEGYPYVLMNIAGAGLACYASSRETAGRENCPHGFSNVGHNRRKARTLKPLFIRGSVSSLSTRIFPE